MRLSALQKDFLGWLVSGDEDAAQSLPLCRAQGLAVYQNNYRASLMECLAQTYPQTMAWLGEADFRPPPPAILTACPRTAGHWMTMPMACPSA
jgi:hypothetical protein